ncbi:serine/threonine-protein kinase [Polyangium aurulentum]|uniref:serine/threonine-protein kinase n=1 Tax=Polyangium aurulentum TaxID=2567896 RepID=UPI00113726D2|nr:serine/threonine-protein kinase [Polyangium aurulentum]UQA62460.1 serine/threonine protein kinase [Polyangium aurulentum]
MTSPPLPAQSHAPLPAPRPAAGQAPPQQAPTGAPGHQSGDLTPGLVIQGRYRIEKLIGRGGMGAVYAVRHVNTGEICALKLLLPALASNPAAVERFRTEARAPVSIGSEHVVRVIDADVAPELGGVPFIVMELLKGRDLGSELKARGALPAGEVVVYLKQVGRVLDKAHGLGIVHRDLKPANLIVTQREDGTPLVKILDFGIAKLLDQSEVGELTQDGAIFGTPWYMSPEQASGKASKVGPPADLWALGLIAYRLLTGKNYWTAEGMAALIGQILYEPMVAPSQMSPHLGPRFDAWFARACNRDAAQRFTNATEQIQQLALALGVNYAAQPTSLEMPSPADLSASGQVRQALQGMPMYGMSMPGTSIPPGMSLPPGVLNANPAMSQSGLPMMGASQPGMPMPGGVTVPPGSTGAPLYATNSPVRQKSSMGAVFAGLLVTLGVVGAAGVFFMLRGKPAEPPPPPVAAAAPAAPTAAPAEPPTPPPPPEPAKTAEVEAAAAPAEPAETIELDEPAKPAEPGAAPTAAPAVKPAATVATATGVKPVAPKPKPSSTVAPKVGNIKF